MSHGKKYSAAYGVMFTGHDEWFDLAKITDFALQNMNLALTIDPAYEVIEAVDYALSEHEVYDGLPYLMERADSSGLLTGALGYDNDAYLLCMAKFPWEAVKDDFASKEAAREQIIKTIMLFTHDAVTEEEIADNIYYFSEELS